MELAAPDWSLMAAALAASVPVCATPGPNNIVCTHIGARYGVRRALPYALGVTVGFPLLVAGAGAGLGTLLRWVPQLQVGVQVVGAGFLVYLAVRIALAAPPAEGGGERGRVPGFVYAVLFQWVNPKAIAYSFSLVALYARPEAMVTDIGLLMAISAAITLPVTMGWAWAGGMLGRFLQAPWHYRLFNGGMAALLLLAVVVG